MQAHINFRNDFGKLDDMVFMTAANVASVIAAPSVGSVYTQLHRGELPEPLIRKNRQLRWTVGQMRGHLAAQLEAFKLAQAERVAATGEKPARFGRKRITAPKN
jgi:hypothetical protein